MAEESVAALTTDLPVKRPREEEEEEANGVVASMETDGTKEPDSISAVIPGWFSEISPMWPGGFSLFSLSFVLFGCEENFGENWRENSIFFLVIKFVYFFLIFVVNPLVGSV